SRIDDVEQPLVRPGLELLAALLVDMRRPVDRELLDTGRQRHRPAHARARPLGSVDDLAGRRIEDAMVERLEPYPDVLAVHVSQRTDDGGRTTLSVATVLVIAALLSSFCPLFRRLGAYLTIE